MLAVIKTGGKQYLVKKGDKIKIEKLDVYDNGTNYKLERATSNTSQKSNSSNVRSKVCAIQQRANNPFLQNLIRRQGSHELIIVSVTY